MNLEKNDFSLAEKITNNSNLVSTKADSFQLENIKKLNISERNVSDHSLKSPSALHHSIQDLSDHFAKTQDSSCQDKDSHKDEKTTSETSNDMETYCSTHLGFPCTSYCKSCASLICEACLEKGKCLKHECIGLPLLHKLQVEQLVESGRETRTHFAQMRNVFDGLEASQGKLRARYEEMQGRVDQFHNYFLQVLQERKEEVQSELEESYGAKMARLEDMKTVVENNLSELSEAEALIETLLPLPFNLKFIRLKLDVIQKIKELVSCNVQSCDLYDSISQLNFHANKHIVRSAVRNVYGKVDNLDCSSYKEESVEKKSDDSGTMVGDSHPHYHDVKTSQKHSQVPCVRGPDAANQSEGVYSQYHNDKNIFAVCNYYQDETSNRNDYNNSNFGSSHDLQNPYNLFYPHSSLPGPTLSQEDLSRAILSDDIFSTEVKRLKMEYHCKFGEFGSNPGQFTEPSGVAVNRSGEILVADANNHRIQAFDSSGVFKRVIGQESLRTEIDLKSQNESDLVYPNRLAVNSSTGDIYVTERSPTHQVRVYDEEGRFVRRFGSHVLQHPRGITVDKMGRIIVVECKVMRVVIFNSSGSVLNRFVVEKKVNFPNGVAVNDREEIFISDNRRHGVVVFDYHGAFLRTIGGTGVTNYPIGVGINCLGELVVADNHNNFNVTIFTQEGKFLRALESKVKHAQCFDTALIGASSIVLSSKDFRIYVYHYSGVSEQ